MKKVLAFLTMAMFALGFLGVSAPSFAAESNVKVEKKCDKEKGDKEKKDKKCDKEKKAKKDKKCHKGDSKKDEKKPEKK